MAQREKTNGLYLLLFPTGLILLLVALLFIKRGGNESNVLGATAPQPAIQLPTSTTAEPTAGVTNPPQPSSPVLFSPSSNPVAPPSAGGLPASQPTPPPPSPTLHPQIQRELRKLVGPNDGKNVSVQIEVRGEKIRFKASADGKMIIKKVIQKAPRVFEDIEIDAGKIQEIKRRLEDQRINIANDGPIMIVNKEDSPSLKTYIPITVDTAAQVMQIQTTRGVEQTAVLPEKANNIVLAKAVIDESLDGPQPVELHDSYDEPLYFVKGTKYKKVLGLFPIAIDKVVVLSAQTGQIYEENKSFWSGLLETIAF